MHINRLTEELDHAEAQQLAEKNQSAKSTLWANKAANSVYGIIAKSSCYPCSC